MKFISSIAARLIISSLATGAMPCVIAAQEPAAPAEDLKQELHQTRQMLQEQAELLRRMGLEMERQGKEIEELRQQLSATPAASTPPFNNSATGDAVRLQNAVQTLRAPAGLPVEQAVPSKGETAISEPSELFFRIGAATFTPSGWVDLTTYYRSNDVGSGLGTNFQSIPYSNTVPGGQSETRMTAQASRFAIRVDEAVGKTRAYGYAEADFNGYLPGNAYVSTNSNSLRMRVYYLNLARGKWEILGGQGWSLLTPTRKALSPFLEDLFNTFHLDTNYQAGLTYARQAQFRLVYHLANHWAAGLSVENPEQFSGSAATFPTLFSNSETDVNSTTGSGGSTATPNRHPDLIVKTTFDRTLNGLYWHVGAAGLLTSARVYTPASVTKGNAASDAREGGGIAGNIFLELFKGFHLLGLGYWSDGGGRYIGGMGPGFVVLQTGSATSPFATALIHSGSGIGGFEWKINRHTTISSYYSTAYFQRRFALDPGNKTATYAGYGFVGSANTNNRTVHEASFASTTTLWQSPKNGALQAIMQSSYVTRAPWYVALDQPENAHTFMEFVNLRYILP